MKGLGYFSNSSKRVPFPSGCFFISQLEQIKVADTESVFLSRVLDCEIREASEVSVFLRCLFIFHLDSTDCKETTTNSKYPLPLGRLAARELQLAV